jgi:hypothetical protein
VSAEKIYQNKFLPIAKYLLKELEYYGENQFKRKTEASDWTIGQLYHHQIQGSYDYHFKAIRDCLAQKNGDLKGSKTIFGFFVFLFNSYPPVKFKGVKGYVPAQIENTAKAKDMMFGYLKEMQKLAREIDKNPENKYKVKHRKLGRLTALEWYKLVVIHQKHHLKQKHRIDKILRTFVKDEVFSDTALVL